MALLSFTALLALASSVHGLTVPGVARDDAIPAAPFVLTLSETVPRPEAKVHALRAMRGSSSNYNAVLGGADGAQEYLTDITIGGQTFKVIIDTGSSDTWLVKKGFSCFNLSDKPKAQSACKFGSAGFDPSASSTFQAIPNKNFNISYEDNEFLTGTVAYETVTVGGLTVKSQEIGVVDKAAWSGDGINSGLIGLGYPAITSAYNGSDPDQDGRSNAAPYNPFFFTAVNEKAVANPYFSVALNRGTPAQQNNQTGFAPNLGFVAFGGMAPVDVTSTAVTVPVKTESTQSGGQGYVDYLIDIDGYAFSGSKKAATTAILDTGTTLNYLPTDVTTAYNALWSPAGKNVKGTGFVVSCSATAPAFAVTIAGQTFTVDSKDLIVSNGKGKNGKEVCISGIQDGGAPSPTNIYILGDVFLHNIVATFAISASTPADNKITLTQRKAY